MSDIKTVVIYGTLWGSGLESSVTWGLDGSEKTSAKHGTKEPVRSYVLHFLAFGAIRIGWDMVLSLVSSRFKQYNAGKSSWHRCRR